MLGSQPCNDPLKGRHAPAARRVPAAPVDGRKTYWKGDTISVLDHMLPQPRSDSRDRWHYPAVQQSGAPLSAE